MDIVVRFNVDNAQFDDTQAEYKSTRVRDAEIAGTLELVALRIRRGEMGDQNDMTIIDVNGNTIGTVEAVDAEPVAYEVWR